MRKMFVAHKIILAVLSCLAGLCTLAQENKKTEPKQIYNRIDFVLKSGDSLVAVVRGGKELGIRKGMLVKAYHAFQSAVPGVSPRKEFQEVGSGKVMELIEGGIMYLINLYQPGDSLEEGDLVSITLQVPVLPYRSIFSELAFQAIEFGNFDKKALYSLNDIFFYDSRKTEDSIMQVIIDDIHATYDLVKDRPNLPEVLTKKASEGRFKGKTPMEVLRDATRKDIEGFLLYVKMYSAGYIGKTYRASESFAGWLSTNSPYSSEEIKRALFPVYRNKIEFGKLLPVYKKDILNEEVSKSLSEEAVTLAYNLKYTEALELVDFARTLAYAVNDTAGKSAVHLNIAQVLQYQEKYELAIPECDKANNFAVQAGKKDLELMALMKKVFCQYKISKYAEAKSTLAAAEKKMADYRSVIGENVYRNNLQKRYEYEGYINYSSGNYAMALVNYAEVIRVNDMINSYDSKIKNTTIYRYIGNVYNEQGKPDSALKSFLKAAEIYKEINDTYNLGLTGNEIAYSYYKLGNYNAALNTLESALVELLKADDSNNAGYSKSLMGSCYWELGKYDSAVIAHKQSIALRRKSNNLSGQAHSWKQIGELYQLSGLKNDALLAYDSAANFYRLVKDNSGLADSYNKKGKVYQNDENYKKAVEFYRSEERRVGKECRYWWA